MFPGYQRQGVGTALLIFILGFSIRAYSWGLGRSGLDMTIVALGTCIVIIAAAQTEYPDSIEMILPPPRVDPGERPGTTEWYGSATVPAQNWSGSATYSADWRVL